jgi:hypothetical protein
MKANLSSILLSALLFINCNNATRNITEESTLNVTSSELETETEQSYSKGYELMRQKCFICHFQKPDPTKRNQMIAPPMLRVQEHYKPAYPNKSDFVKATIAFINNPSKETTLMPGAVKKFNLMPKLVYDEKELQLITETLYDMDFGKTPKLKMQMMGANGLQLNNGKKWKLRPESIKQMDAVIRKVNDFKSDNIADYNQLGKDVFNDAKMIILDDSYTDEKFNQIHLFFNGIEGNMHTLMAIQSKDEAKNQLSELKIKLNEFNSYFE